MENKIARLGEKIKRIYHPGSANDYEALFDFYISRDPRVRYTIDPGVTRIGSVVVQSPDTCKGYDRGMKHVFWWNGNNRHSPRCLQRK